VTGKRYIHVVDDEAVVRASIVSLVEEHGPFECREYRSGDAFLQVFETLEPGCVVLDLQLGGVNGIGVMQVLARHPERFRTIVITGFGDLPMAIEAFRAGAVDFLFKPYETRPLLEAVDRAFYLIDHGAESPARVAEAQARLARLDPFESGIFAALIRGRTHQDIGEANGLDARAVQVHRARILALLEAPSLLAAMRTAVIAGWTID